MTFSVLNSRKQLRYAPPPVRVRSVSSSPTTTAPSCAAFIHDLVVIDDAQPGDGELATMPFHLWEKQEELLKEIEGERLLIILKARQLGISWLVLAYALWLCLYHPGRLVNRAARCGLHGE